MRFMERVWFELQLLEMRFISFLIERMGKLECAMAAMMGKPNRYGGPDMFVNGRADGEACCRHNVPLWCICVRCDELLSWVRDPEIYKRRNLPQHTDPDWVPELPTLCGTGDVVEFDA